MAYILDFVGLSYQGEHAMVPLTNGYQARAWLPAYDTQSFGTIAEAEAWIEANQRGPDLATVRGLFFINEG